MPHFLAEEAIRGLDSSVFIMISKHLAKNDVPMRGFYYQERRAEGLDLIEDIRPAAKIPSDASDSSSIEYVYEETEYNYLF